MLTTDPVDHLDWPRLLVDQLDWHWGNHLRPRLAGLTDEEWSWEPVPGCWGVRPRGTSPAPISVGAGDWTMDYGLPEPDPAPVTTIAWRLAHVTVGCLGGRAAAHFGTGGVDYESFPYAGTATGALAQLDEAYAAWVAGVRSLGAAGLVNRCGPAEGPWSDSPMAELVLHITREVVHHGAEVALLRDLYLRRDRT